MGFNSQNTLQVTYAQHCLADCITRTYLLYIHSSTTVDQQGSSHRITLAIHIYYIYVDCAQLHLVTVVEKQLNDQVEGWYELKTLNIVYLQSVEDERLLTVGRLV